MSIICIFLCSTIVLCLFALFQLKFSESIFNCNDAHIYERQWIPVLGLFYSFYLRQKHGYLKGHIYESDMNWFYLLGPFFGYDCYKDRYGNNIPEEIVDQKLLARYKEGNE